MDMLTCFRKMKELKLKFGTHLILRKVRKLRLNQSIYNKVQFFLMFSFSVSGEASLVLVFVFALSAWPDLCMRCMHAAHVVNKISFLREHTLTVRASKRFTTL